MGLSLGGVEFLEGALPGIEGYAIGWMTKSRRGKLYIDDSGWGPEANSIEYGYRFPFGKIHVSIGKIGKSRHKLDIYMDIIERLGARNPLGLKPTGIMSSSALPRGSISRTTPRPAGTLFSILMASLRSAKPNRSFRL